MARRKRSGIGIFTRRGNAASSNFGRTTALLLLCSLLSALPSLSIGQEIHELVTTYEGGWIQDGVMFDVQTTAVASADSTASTPDGITIHGLNLLTPLTEMFCVELYTKSGTFSSAASNPAEWIFLGSFSLLGQGPTTPTSIPLGAFDPITIGLGDTQAFYVTTQDEKLRYTALDPNDYVTGDVYTSSDPHYATATERGIDAGDVKVKPARVNGRNKEGGRTGGRQREGERKNGRARGDEGDDSERLLQSTDGLSVQILTGVAKNYPFAESWPHRVFNGALLYSIGADSTLSLTDDQLDKAWKAKRGSVTCDVDAIPMESYPSVAPSDPRVPTTSPIKSPTVSPTKAPTLSPTSQPTTLESTIKKVATTLHGGLKQSGVMFDIRVPSVEEGGPPEGVTVIAIEMSTFQTEEICVEVYSKSGTYMGFEQDVVQEVDGTWSSPSWSILGAATVEGKGERNPTHIPIGALDPVHVPAGERQAFYVTLTEPEMRYTEPRFKEQSGDVFSGSPPPDRHMELMVGSAVSYPFGEVWEDRIFNGAVVYALGDIGDSKYNTMTSADRDRSCPMPPTTSPTAGPTTSPSKAPTPAPSTPAPTTPAPTSGPSAAAVNAIAATEAATATEAAATTVPPTTTEAAASEVVATESATATEAAGSSSDVVDSVDTPEPTTVAATTAATVAATTEATSTSDETQEAPQVLSGRCPDAETYGDSTKDVEVLYKYTMITDRLSDDTDTIVAWMENVLHTSLMLKECSVNITGRRKMKAKRMLQEISYQGFNSLPPDQVSGEGCGEDVTLVDGQGCYLVTGGVTAVVASDADEEAVKADVGASSEAILTDPKSYQSMGVKEVVYIAPVSETDPTETDKTETDPDTDTGTGTGTDNDNEGGDTQDLEIVGAVGGNQDPDPPSEEKSNGLSTTGIIIISVLAGTLFFVILAFAAFKMRKRRRLKRADSKELFREFPEEEERIPAYGGLGSNTYGLSGSSSYGYNDSSFSPVTGSILSQPPPPPPPRTRSGRSVRSVRSTGSSAASPAVILNEQDDISLYSSAKSKSRFAPSSMLAPDSPGSRGSKGSNSSKKSVEFVRAGQSFSSRASNQPEDTVDL